jgi:hypothetical protein
MPATAADPRLRILDEGALPIPEAWAAVVGRPLNIKSLLRYAIGGLRGIRLESIKAGGRRLTSTRAVERFLAATQTVESQPRAACIDVVAADKVLAAFGLGREATR